MDIMTVENISKGFPCGTQALKNISFVLEKGDFVVIGGANGSGKSLLMSILAGLENPTSGTVRFHTENQQSPFIGLIFQDADAQILGETCEEDIAFGLNNFGIEKTVQTLKITQALENVHLLHKRFSLARFLSGGEKRRLAVASVLALQSEIIIFDEPFANLDWHGVQQVCKILEVLRDEGKTVLVLTHELEKVLARANRLLILFEGNLVFDGTPTEGLQQNIAQWSIRNPLVHYISINDLWWG